MLAPLVRLDDWQQPQHQPNEHLLQQARQTEDLYGRGLPYDDFQGRQTAAEQLDAQQWLAYRGDSLQHLANQAAVLPPYWVLPGSPSSGGGWSGLSQLHGVQTREQGPEQTHAGATSSPTTPHHAAPYGHQHNSQSPQRFALSEPTQSHYAWASQYRPSVAVNAHQVGRGYGVLPVGHGVDPDTWSAFQEAVKKEVRRQHMLGRNWDRQNAQVAHSPGRLYYVGKQDFSAIDADLLKQAISMQYGQPLAAAAAFQQGPRKTGAELAELPLSVTPSPPLPPQQLHGAGAPHITAMPLQVQHQGGKTTVIPPPPAPRSVPLPLLIKKRKEQKQPPAEGQQLVDHSVHVKDTHMTPDGAAGVQQAPQQQQGPPGPQPMSLTTMGGATAGYMAQISQQGQASMVAGTPEHDPLSTTHRLFRGAMGFTANDIFG